MLSRFHLLFLCLLVIGAGNSMLSALLPPLVRRLGLADSTIGWIFSLSAVLWVFTSPYWGRLSDKAGRKPVIASGLAAYAVSMGAFALVCIAGLLGWVSGMALFIGLMLTRAIFGAFGSASSPAAQAYVADRSSISERTEQLASLTAAFALGSALGPALCAMIAARVGLVAPLVLVSAIAAGASYCIWRFLPEPEPPQVERGARVNLWDSFQFARDRRIAGFLIFGLGLSTVTGVLQQVFALFIMDRLDVQGSAGAELSALGFMVFAITLLATQMAILPRVKLGVRMLMIVGASLIAVGVLVQMLAPSLGAMLVSQVIQGLGFGLARPGFTGGASMAVRADEQGPSAGLVVAVNGAGFVVSPIAGGVAYEYLGMNAPLIITLVILAGMIAFAYRSRRIRDATAIVAPSVSEP